MMGAVFAMQGFGQLGAAIVMICVTVGFKESLHSAKSYATCQGVCGIAVDKVSLPRGYLEKASWKLY
jgi:PHS family inorganic phosphate transporter-like MFS transporter